jgi:hypothetical protein
MKPRSTGLTAAVALTGALAVSCAPGAPPAVSSNSSTVSPAPAPAPAAVAPATPAPAAPVPAPAAPASAANVPSSAATAPAPTPELANPPAPTAREVTIPANTRLTVTLATPVASDASRVEDVVLASLAQPLVIAGTTVLPAGTELRGTILQSTRSGRVKGKASVAFRFDRLTVRNEALAIQTARISREAASSRSSDVKKGAIGGAIGAVVGGIAGGGTGAAIGAAAGGTGTVLATRGNEVRLPAGTTVTTTLQKPLTILVPID